MKLTYEQMRHLAELSDPPGRHQVKNRKGIVLRPPLKKWGRNHLETKSTSSPALLKPYHAHTAPHSQTSPQVFCSLLPPRQVNRK